MVHDIRAILLGGGIGSRLEPLTGLDPKLDRPKPNVPLEKRRLIDFAVSNCLHSRGIADIQILAQAHPNKLSGHIQETYLSHEVGRRIRVQVAPMIHGHEYFAGTADAVRMSNYLLDDGHESTLVLAGDHLYLMKYDDFVDHHLTTKADVTVMVQAVPAVEAGDLGVFAVNSKGAVEEFIEKPTRQNIPVPLIPGTDQALASLGIYVFKTKVLQKLLTDTDGNDFGHDVIPLVLSDQATNLKLEVFRHEGYWRDVGTIGSLWQANMDIIGPAPKLNLYDPTHQVFHRSRHLPSPKFINGCSLRDAIVSDGSIVAGRVESSVLSTRVRVGCDANLHECVVLDKTMIGANTRLHRVFADKEVQIGPGIILGQNPQKDVETWPEQLVLKDGILVVRRGAVIGDKPNFG
ncbi:MAG: sugar phosphate nucleotidyltransferase [Patescibacteria group bacterium]|nr:sugar phosphate nucleotidyltransferase [Patescibacteria group bacterium]